MRSNYDKNISRLEFQAANMLEQSNDKVTLAEQAKTLNEAKELSDAIYTSNGAYVYNKRMKALEQDRTFSYKNNFIVKALTEALSSCANNALLLNAEEYEKINPNYKAEIKETIHSFLENAKIDPSKAKINPDLLAIYEEIVKEVPPADLYLTEEDEEKVIYDNIMSNSTVNNKLDNICRDVRARVANIVTKDQEALVAEQDDLDYIANKEAQVAPIVPVQPEPVVDAPLADPEDPSTDVVQQPETQPINNMPIQQTITESANIIRKKSKKHGIVETIAMNEATQMLAEGKAYDKTLAIANTVKFITVLETLDASGAVEIGPAGYNNILAASGAEVKLPTAKINGDKLEEVESPKFGINTETTGENKTNSKISDILHKSFDNDLIMATNSNIFKPELHIPVKSKVSNPALDVVNKTADVKGKYTSMKGEVYTEQALREFFENQGFDLNYVDFDTLAYNWHFKKN